MYDKICKLCKEKGMTISELEKAVGLSNASIRKWETAVPRVDNVQKVATFFGVTVDALLSESD